MKRLIALSISILLTVSALTGCDIFRAASTQTPDISADEPVAVEPEPLPPTKPYISVISTGVDSQFWRAVTAGANDAADKYDIVLNFIVPQAKTGEKALAIAPEKLGNNTSAVCIAAGNEREVSKLLEYANENGIPVVGFDTGVPGASPGALLSTAATDNYAAGAVAAEAMFGSPIFVEKMRNATVSSPATIAVLVHDSALNDVSERVRGFIDKMAEKVKAINPGGVQVSDGEAGAVILSVADASEASSTLQQTERLIGVFCSGLEAAESLLDATSGGTALDRGHGEFKDLTIIGFDAGERQKAAVKSKYFYGAVTQDPYMMGYMAIELAYDALQGDTPPETADTGCWLYTYENIDSKSIASLLYD